MITRSPHKFNDLKPTITVVEAQLDEADKLKEVFVGIRWRRAKYEDHAV